MKAAFLGEHTDAALRASLRGGLLADEVEVLGQWRLSGGAVQENWALDVRVHGGDHAGTQALVLRTDAPQGLASSLTRRDEFDVLTAVWKAGMRVPRPLYLESDPDVLGRPFYVMSRIPGEASAHRLLRATVDGEVLVEALGAQLGALHRIVPPWPGLEALPVPDLPAAQYRVQAYRNFLDAMAMPQPTLEWALRWLESHAPPEAPLSLCHGDFRTGNYLVDQGQLGAILDWEFAGFSDPHEDLGWFCARCWRFGRDDRPAGGMGSRDALYAGYARGRGVDVQAELVPYWEIMATARWAVIALQQGERYLSGSERSLEAVLTARLVPDMELDLLEQIEAYERGDRSC